MRRSAARRSCLSVSAMSTDNQLTHPQSGQPLEPSDSGT